MKTYKYLLTVQMPFEAMDDLAARQRVEEYLSKAKTTDIFPENTEYKLQRLQDNAPPVGLQIKKE